MSRTRIIIATAILAALVVPLSLLGQTAIAPAGAARPHVTLTASAPRVVTFGMTFKKGEIPAGMWLSNHLNEAVDMACKTLWDDKSARFAVITMRVPKGETPVTFKPMTPLPAVVLPPLEAAAFIHSDQDLVVKLKLQDGPELTASAKKTLQAAGDKMQTWLSGQGTSEWIVAGPLTDKDGKADPELWAQFSIRAKGSGAANRADSFRVGVVVENCFDSWPGNVKYAVSIVDGAGKSLYENPGIDHLGLARWRKVFWLGQPVAPVEVKYDFEYLSATGAVPHYDSSVQIPDKVLAARDARWQGPKTDISGSGSLTAYMPTTGGRAEIAPYPNWTVLYLLSMDDRAKEVVLGNGDLGGSWPIHVRNRKTGRIMTIDERPKFWLDSRGQDKPTFQPDRQKATMNPPLVPETAHHPSLAYVPYLVTGDFFYLEEHLFWANWCLLAQNPGGRQNEKGISSDQIRGNAWNLRDWVDAAVIAPADWPEQKYFTEKVNNNLAGMTGRMYGPPVYSPLGQWGPAPSATPASRTPPTPTGWCAPCGKWTT